MGLIITIVVILLGFFYGKAAEQNHFKKLKKLETKLANMPWRSNGKKEKFNNFQDGKLLTGSVVIAQDAFKAFFGNILGLFGGRITVYETLLDRARREALVRLRLSAQDWGAKELVNVRIETSTIGTNNAQQRGGAVEVVAYGTALR